MRLLALALVAIVSLSFISRGFECLVADASADTGSAVGSDAGSGSGSSVGSAAAPSASSQLHNPTTDPAKAVADVESDWKSGGWTLGVLAAMFMLLELAAYAGTKYSTISALAWLGKGRVSTVIAGATAIAAAMIDKLAAGGAWTAVISAAIAAGLLYYHPAGTDPAKA